MGGRISLNIYFNHVYVGIIVAKLCENYQVYQMFIVYFVGIFICTMINIYFSAYIKRVLSTI